MKKILYALMLLVVFASCSNTKRTPSVAKMSNYGVETNLSEKNKVQKSSVDAHIYTALEFSPKGSQLVYKIKSEYNWKNPFLEAPDGSQYALKAENFNGVILLTSASPKNKIYIRVEEKEDGLLPVNFVMPELKVNKKYGKTYVEISLADQTMWLVKDGKVALTTPIVTGRVSWGKRTPKGVFKVSYKARNATLTGQDYEADVAYWIPFNRNVGMHDATWRRNFGGTIYKEWGSHGCINTPFENIKYIFENVKAGTPVIVR